MTTQQQQEPILAMTLSQWNEWFAGSFSNFIKPHRKAIANHIDNLVDDINHNNENVGNDLDAIAEAIGAKKGADGKLELRKLGIDHHTQKISELLEIVQELAVGNDFLGGRIDQISREFKHQNGIEPKEVSRTRMVATTTTEQHSSRVEKTLNIIDEVLHG